MRKLERILEVKEISQREADFLKENGYEIISKADNILYNLAGSPAKVQVYKDDELFCEKLVYQKFDDSDDAKEISSELQSLRLEFDLSQEQFCEMFEIPIGTLRNWEQNRRVCPGYLLKLIKYRLYN